MDGAPVGAYRDIFSCLLSSTLPLLLVLPVLDPAVDGAEFLVLSSSVCLATQAEGEVQHLPTGAPICWCDDSPSKLARPWKKPVRESVRRPGRMGVGGLGRSWRPHHSRVWEEA